MTIGLHDKVRQGALAKARRLDAARKTLSVLTDEECEVIYIELESRLEAKVSGTKTTAQPSSGTASARRHCTTCGAVGHNSRSCKKPKKVTSVGDTKAKKTAAPKSRYTDMIEEILRDNPQGLRAYEIAEKTGQSTPNTYGILKLLERQERVERHGERYNTLWTLPGGTPHHVHVYFQTPYWGDRYFSCEQAGVPWRPMITTVERPLSR
jgi:hypothetical protein